MKINLGGYKGSYKKILATSRGEQYIKILEIGQRLGGKEGVIAKTSDSVKYFPVNGLGRGPWLTAAGCPCLLLAD